MQTSWSAGQLTVHGDWLPKAFKIICTGKVFAWGYAAAFTPACLCMAALRCLHCSPVHSEAHVYIALGRGAWVRAQRLSKLQHAQK